MIALDGSCHCGALQLRYTTSFEPEQTHPRACDCSFCRKHQAAYVSDPQGQIAITIKKTEHAHRYRQGSENADFLLCAHCGVLVAVVFYAAPYYVGAINYQCLERRAEFANEQSASPQQLSAEQKQQRWRQLWSPTTFT